MLEFIKNFDFSISYHRGKINVIQYALSQNPLVSLSNMLANHWKIMEDMN